ncbi:phosphoribosyl-AMP cyclohydrolase [Terasakiella brassicae]|uniref:Phosphoribosyl-AMP cyclohydrolase n=1 Tax=Terasakiella brassicae TaxID=1634917 RepID=A0A917BMZ6_9PROT|nr:phosphoribosyl-AMP cyclohydrolase [Terasakiella brassicae]GGF51191.1 phosphoribosyl-AMP cyclohydrolase [Terasakiella brassicae]
MCSKTDSPENIVDALKYNSDGLIPAIAQQHDSGEILMMAWMNKEAVAETLKTGRVCYYSRSRQQLWRKGESSGQQQELIDFRTDCDKDTVLVSVNQTGVACHTGRRSCFSWAARDGKIETVEEVIVSPDKLYKK